MLCEICKKEWDPKCSWTPCQLIKELRRGNNETSRPEETPTTVNS